MASSRTITPRRSKPDLSLLDRLLASGFLPVRLLASGLLPDRLLRRRPGFAGCCGVCGPGAPARREEHEPAIGLHVAGREIAVGPFAGFFQESRLLVVAIALAGQYIGDVAEIEMTDDAVEFCHVD